MSNSSPLLYTKDLVCGYTKKKQLDFHFKVNHISLEQGKLNVLLGQNGTGKTSLLRTLQGLVKPLNGQVFLCNKPISHFARKEIAKTMAFVTTNNLAVSMSVKELIGLGRYPYTNLWGRLQAKDEEIINHCLDSLSLQAFANKPLSQLSDGQRQKVMIARALAQEPSLLLLDEPIAFLDWVARRFIMESLQAIVKEKNIAVLVSLHDIPLAMQYADKIFLMPNEVNKEMWQGTKTDLIQGNRLQQSFPLMTEADSVYIKNTVLSSLSQQG